MDGTPVEYGHLIKVRYHGPGNVRGSRWGVTWEGWTSENSRPVRRFYQYDRDRDTMAQQIASDFAAWLSKMPGDDNPRTFTPDRITMADAGPDGWVIIVHTRDAREA